MFLRHSFADLGLKMIFTWDTTNLCIIFRWWRITGVFSLLVSLAAVAGITALYELVREASRRYEAKSQEYLNSLPSTFTFLLKYLFEAKA